MTEYKLFKTTIRHPANNIRYEFYIVIDDRYYFWDTSYDRYWLEGFYRTWQEKLEQDGEVISETSKLEILVLAGPRMVENIEALEGKGKREIVENIAAFDSKGKKRISKN